MAAWEYIEMLVIREDISAVGLTRTCRDSEAPGGPASSATMP